MPPMGAARHFEIVRRTLALAEERGAIALTEAAEAVGVTRDRLRELLDPVLFLEYRTFDGRIIGRERAFLLTETDHLMLTQEHWLRDLRADPPPVDVALRLLIEGLTVQAVSTEPTPDLARALTKLRDVVAADLHLDTEQPPCLPVVQQAYEQGRSLRFRYVKDDDAPTDREVLPGLVFCRWGHWYCHGPEVGGDVEKFFRVDRMLDARVGDVEFDPPPDEVPEWFDLGPELTVRVRLARDALTSLPQPLTVKEVADLGAGRVEADITLAGERRLDHLLVCLEPDAEIVAPEGLRDRRRAHARRLLEEYAGA